MNLVCLSLLEPRTKQIQENHCSSTSQIDKSFRKGKHMNIFPALRGCIPSIHERFVVQSLVKCGPVDPGRFPYMFLAYKSYMQYMAIKSFVVM